MTDTRSFTRDLRGRFTSTVNAPESAEGKFETWTELPVKIQGADPAELAYGSVARHAPEGDDLAGRPYPGALRPRGAILVQGDEEARTKYGVQGALGREAARLHAGPMDPSTYLTGAE